MEQRRTPRSEPLFSQFFRSVLKNLRTSVLGTRRSNWELPPIKPLESLFNCIQNFIFGGCLLLDLDRLLLTTKLKGSVFTSVDVSCMVNEVAHLRLGHLGGSAVERIGWKNTTFVQPLPSVLWPKLTFRVLTNHKKSCKPIYGFYLTLWEFNIKLNCSNIANNFL